MPLQEFWNEDPDLLWIYRTSYMNRQKNEAEIINYQAWLQGLYNHQAIASALSKGVKYLEKPLDLEGKTKEKQQIELTNKIKQRAMQCKAMIQQRREKKG